MMSTNGAMGTEGIEIIKFVRMDDIQPRNPAKTLQNSSEMLETCIVGDGDFEACVMDDEYSNVGSIVSVNLNKVQEEVLIVPEALESDLEDAEPTGNSEAQDLKETQEFKEVPESQSVSIQVMQMVKVPEETSICKPPSMSWPTLEILPGGVINQLADKGQFAESKAKKEMMYACAKCSQSFRHLFCLVKHVKWHEDQDKKKKLHCSKLIKSTNKICSHTLKKRCKKIPKNS